MRMLAFALDPLEEKMSTAISLLIFILILGIVVFVHEFGHFIMARRAGIFVEEFAMGMGPKLLTFRGKKKSQHPREGEEDVTLYTLRALPLGGFCKMRGMEESITGDPEAMNNKGLFDRILVIVGGSGMNFVLALVLFTILNFLVGYTSTQAIVVANDSPAQRAGLQNGDHITHINGSRVTLWENFRFTLDMNAGAPMDVRVNRGGERVNLTITPERGADGVYRIGMNPALRVGFLQRNLPGAEALERTTVVSSIGNSAETIGFHIRAPFRMLARFLTRQPVPEGSGVIGIVGLGELVTQEFQTTMQAEQHAVRNTIIQMLNIAAIISVALGVMNLLPIPALDGARLVFLLVEGIRRKPVSPEREGMVHLVGFAVLIALIIFITYRDIANIVTRNNGTQYEESYHQP